MGTYTGILGLQNTWDVGETAGTTWFGGVANTAETLLASRAEVDLSGNSDVTPDAAPTARVQILSLIGALTGNVNLILPAWDGKRWLVLNGTTGAFTVTVKTAVGTGVVITQGYGCEVYSDGTNILRRGVESNGTTVRLSAALLAGVVSSPVAAVQNLTTGATIALPTGGRTKRLSASGGAVTGIILPVGTVDGQELILFNTESANTITFAAAATSNVADGTAAVIGALRALVLVWDATSNRWYRTG